MLWGVDSDRLKGVEGPVERAIPTPALQLVGILPEGHTQILNLGHVVFYLLALLFVHLEVETPVVQTLAEVLLQGLFPHSLERVLLIQHLLIMSLQPIIDDRNGLGGVGWEQLEDLLAQVAIRLLNELEPQGVELLGVDQVLVPLFLTQTLNSPFFIFEDLNGLLVVVDLVVHLVHLVFGPEEHVLVLVLVLELEALRTLRQARVHIVQQGIEVRPHLWVLPPFTNRLWELVGNFIVGVADLLELGGVKLAQRLAQ